MVRLKNLFTNRLYWKISLTFLGVLILLGIAYVGVTVYTEQKYFQEANQRLYGSIAEHMVKEVKPYIDEGGNVDTSHLSDIMHSMMVINPNVEVYLLDKTGRIVSYVVPEKAVKLDHVDLQPVQHFIRRGKDEVITGDDPRNPGVSKVFSAAPFYDEQGALNGYAYIILASAEQAEVTSAIYKTRLFTLGGNLFFLTLLGAFVIGVLALGYFTRRLTATIETVRRFKDGDLQARIPESTGKDLPVLSETFNEMADRIVANIEELKSVENLRRELIANVSHDLRTPLAIMQGYIETLQIKDDQLKPEERNKYLNIVLSSSQKLSRLVQQLFEYSKLEAKQIIPEKEPFFITELAHDISNKFKILADKKDITINLDMHPDLPMVFADVALVERVMQNLLDNALKYTPKGGQITIAISANDHVVEVRVTDDGPGIPEEEQAFIFERYRKAKQTAKEKVSSTGLGLAIARKIMDLHNSTISVISKPNQGATFLFALPAHG
ncbi:MAG: HAMP domain-containing sensor histidine kinase [Saprospiraceae bacterium]